MNFWYHLRILLWKNILLKYRNPRSTIFEILLPLAIAGAMTGIFTLFIFTTYPVTTYAQYGNDIQRVGDFQQAALLMTKQLKRLAIIPRTPDLLPYVNQFIQDMSIRYPSFDGRYTGGANMGEYYNHTGFQDPKLRITLPGFADVITTVFQSELELDEWIKNIAYPSIDPFGNKGRIWAAIIFEKGPPDWSYTIRMNASELPSTTGPMVDILQRGYIPWEAFKYLWAIPFVSSGDVFGGGDWNYDNNDLSRRSLPGFIQLQLLIDRWIINTTLPFDAWTNNDGTSKLANSYWTLLQQDSQSMWNELYGPPEDNDYSRKDIWRSNVIQDMVNYSKGDLYFPQGIDIAPFPTTSYVENFYYATLQYSMPFAFMISFLYPASRLMFGLVNEKETRLREGMRQMGVNNFAVLLSWIIIYETQYIIVALGIAGIMSSSVFQLSGFGPLFLLFGLFGTASVSFAAFVSIFFTKARTASTLGTLAYLVSFFPFYATGTSDSAVSRGGKLGACILPPTAFANTLAHIMAFEGGGTGVLLGGSNDNTLTQLRGFSYADGMALLSGSTILFILLNWYIDLILPYPLREFGVPLPWYFPCTLRYWRGQSVRSDVPAENKGKDRKLFKPSISTKEEETQNKTEISIINVVNTKETPITTSVTPTSNPAINFNSFSPSGISTISSFGMVVPPPPSSSTSSTPHNPVYRRSSVGGYIESLDSHLIAKENTGRCVTLTGIHKSFSNPDGSTMIAVNNVDLTLYEGQITVLLGHNGAGKTTLLSMLSGLIAPTSGNATVFGRDLGTDLQAIQRDLGICPQHDVLWPDLTVEEHLHIFANIKNLSSEKTYRDTLIRKALQDVGLLSKAHSQTKTLSGGQKRKLSVAIALLGDSKVILLDEPTSGMDPFSRRATWQLLQRSREGRVIILTTHFMDEADILGDRIAIMSHGQLHSCGSPMFLKKVFGVGYTLTLEKSETDTLVPAHRTNSITTTTVPIPTHNPLLNYMDRIKLFIPEAEVANLSLSQLIIRLPLHTSSLFPKLLQDLEQFIFINNNDENNNTKSNMNNNINLPSLGPLSIGVTTMEDVFLRVESNPAHQGTNIVDKSTVSSADPTTSNNVNIPVPDPNSDSKTLTKTQAGCFRQFRALYYKRFLYAKRDIRGACLQLLLPIVLVVVGFVLLNASNTGDQPKILLKPLFNLDPTSSSSTPLYPNHVPTFTFKSTDYPLPSNDIEALISLMGLGENEYYYDSYNERLVLSIDNMQTFPDPYDIAKSPLGTTGPRNNGWPTKGYEQMSSFLISEKELQVHSGKTSTLFPNGDGNIRDGSSIYGAFIFTLNGSTVEGQALTEAFIPARLRQEEILSNIIDMSHVYQPNPSAALTIGVMINTTAKHAGPIYTNMITSAIYRLRRAVDYAIEQGKITSLDNYTYNATTIAMDARKAHDQKIRSAGSITIYNHPLPYTTKESAATSAVFTFGAAAIVTMAFAFLPATYASFAVRERETGAKHQQRLSGVSAVAYWSASYMFDISMCIIPAAVTILAAWGFDIKEFVGTDYSRLSSFIALFALYGAAVAPFSYMLSFLFRTNGGAQAGVLLISVLSLLLMIASLALRQIPDTCKEEGILRFVFRLLPGYSLGNGLMTLSFLSSLAAVDANCAYSHGEPVDMTHITKYDALDLNATGWNIIYLAVEAIVYGLITVAIDAGMELPWIRSCQVRRATQKYADIVSTTANTTEDPDVRTERKRIAAVMNEYEFTKLQKSSNVSSYFSTLSAQYSVILFGLRKIFPPQQSYLGYLLKKLCCCRRCCACCSCCRSNSRATSNNSDNSSTTTIDEAMVPKVAVNSISFALQPGEVFGFLGVNGAGKTTTLQILSGDTLPTSGTALMGGYDVINEQHLLRQLLGYCPQFDALLDLLTVKEHIELYARIRGIPENQVSDMVTQLINRLDLSKYTNNLAGKLSGGNKRKLSVAVALIGNPPIIFLDEPSTGMDPVAKRFMWKVISNVANEQRKCSIILTTHSMEEVEALCSRIGIMSNGTLQVIGSAAHLKTTHGQGYQLQLQLRSSLDNEIQQLIKTLITLNITNNPLLTEYTIINRQLIELFCKQLNKENYIQEIKEGGTGWAIATDLDNNYQHTSRKENDNKKLITINNGNNTTSPSSSLPSSPPSTSTGVTLLRFCTWINEEDLVNNVLKYFTTNCGGKVIERHGMSLRLRLPAKLPIESSIQSNQITNNSNTSNSTTKLSTIFTILESVKDTLGIMTYGLGETTLEQVFNIIAGENDPTSSVSSTTKIATATNVVGRGTAKRK